MDYEPEELIRTLWTRNGTETTSCVYGIVTNYINWVFLRSLDDKIERTQGGSLQRSETCKYCYTPGPHELFSPESRPNTKISH